MNDYDAIIRDNLVRLSDRRWQYKVHRKIYYIRRRDITPQDRETYFSIPEDVTQLYVVDEIDGAAAYDVGALKGLEALCQYLDLRK
jgi:hypothetical protein